MADGATGGSAVTRTSRNVGARLRALSAKLLSRTFLLTIWIIVAMAGLALGAYFAIRYDIPTTQESIAYAIAATNVLLLPVLLILADPDSNLAKGPQLRLPVITTTMLMAFSAFAVADSYEFHLLAEPAARLAFFSVLGTTLLARAWNAIRFWRLKAENHRAAEEAARLGRAADELANRHDDVDRKVSEYRAAESVSAFVVTVVVAGIIGAAYWIGTFPSDPSLGASLGVGIFLLVVTLFAIVLAIDWLADTPLMRGAGLGVRILVKPGAIFAAIYNAVDATLVYAFGHVAGADHLKPASRYLILGVTLLCLGVMGWYLPPPWGLVPILIGLVLGLSVSRLWSWVEEDRNLASITQFSPSAPQRIGFREDYRDETLLGFIFVLALIPIGIMQVHESNLLGGPLFTYVSDPTKPIEGHNFFVWLGYFGFELAKALPIVDWADIYHLGPGNDSIAPTRPLGMHAVFAARVLVDLLLIAALLQAMGIASRNRQQKYLYAEGHINRLDQLVEKQELARAIRASLEPQSDPPHYALARLGKTNCIDFRRYSEARLREVYLRSKREDVRGFITALFNERGVKPAPAMDLVQDIAASHQSELDLIRMFDEAKYEHSAGIYTITHEDLASVLFDLRNSTGMKDFKHEVIDYGATLGSADAGIDMLTTVAVGAGRDAFLYTRRKAAETIASIAPRATNRDVLLTSLAEFEAREDAFGASRLAWRIAVDALRKRLLELG